MSLCLCVCCLLSSAHAGEDADFNRAKGYYTLQEYKLSAESLDKYLTAYPQSLRAEEGLLLLAESHYQLKAYADAARAFDRFLSAYPQSPRRAEALLRAVKAHFLLKEYAPSLKAAETFINENRAKLAAPSGAQPALPAQFATALYHAGEDSYALKDSAKAKTYWTELLTTQPNSPLAADASDGLGYIAFDAGDYQQAIERFQVPAKTPNHPRAAAAMLMEGRALAALKRYDEALAALKAAPALSGGSKEIEAESVLRTAEVCLDAGRPESALESYRLLAKDYAAFSLTTPALSTGARRLFDAQRMTETVAVADLFLAAAANSPERAVVLRLKARSLTALQRNPEALAAAQKAVEEASAQPDAERKNENHPAGLMLLAELSGKDGEAPYKELVRLYPLSRYGLAARYELARLAGEAGKLAEALAECEALLQALPAPVADKSLAPVRRDALFAAAEFAFRIPEYQKAEVFLKTYQQENGEQDARSDDVARKLAWCRYNSGDAAGAATLLQSALPKYQKSRFRDEMLYLSALAATKTGAPETALKFDETLAADFPASPFVADTLYDAASILFKQGKLEPALEKLNKLLGDKAFQSSWLRNAGLQLRASILLQSGKAAEAAADADALLKALPAVKDSSSSLPAARLLKALALLAQNGKEKEAEAALNEVIAAGPADAPEIRQALLRRAYLYFNAKQYAQAKADFARLVPPRPLVTGSSLEAPALSAEEADAALRLALCHKELKETAEAKDVLNMLTFRKVQGPVAFEAPFQFGNIAFETADDNDAIASYELALTVMQNTKDVPLATRSAARLNLGWSLKRSGEKERAAKVFAELIQADPSGAFTEEAMFERGRLLAELGKRDEAMQLWRELVEKKKGGPFTEKALFLLSQAQAQAGQYKEAAAGFEQYLKEYPAGASAREANCGLAECSLQTGNILAARDAFNKVLGAKGVEADLDDAVERALLVLADLNLRQGNALAAKKLALRILTEHPDSTWADGAYMFAGKASESLNEPERAIGYYRKLLAERAASPHAAAASERLKALGAPQTK